MRKYKIYMMSARNIISYAEKDSDSIYKFNLQARETEKCKVPTASHEQESNALFHQIMCQLHGDNFEIPEDINLITDLENVIFYIDFAGIFDRNGEQKRYFDPNNCLPATNKVEPMPEQPQQQPFVPRAYPKHHP